MVNKFTDKVKKPRRSAPPHKKIKTNYASGVLEWTARYSQEFRFDEKGLGNMMLKSSSTANAGGRIFGDPLDYQLDYEYMPRTRKAVRIGSRHYRYDSDGNLAAEQEGPFAETERTGSGNVTHAGNDVYFTEGAWGLGRNAGGAAGVLASGGRLYGWDERGRLIESADSKYSVKYTYGHDGERTGKYAVSGAGGGESETLYFNKMWNWRHDGLLSDSTGKNSKHIFLGETRILTKVTSGDGSFTDAEWTRQYYYHSDHLGSAQLITNHKGEEYERLEYTPYGELWIEKAPAVSALEIPYRFTGKEQDSETGLYYYGARYLDAKTSRWLSADPAVAEYVPAAGGKNGSLPNGGVYNFFNLHVFHYSNNNPVKYTDPDGRTPVDYEKRVKDVQAADSAGNRSRQVINGQDKLFGSHMYKQGGGGNYPEWFMENRGVDQTFCSPAVFDLADAVNFSQEALYGTGIRRNTSANAAGANLASAVDKGLIKEITSDKIAHELANEGFLVIASWVNPSGEGHLATVRPGREYDSDDGPVLANFSTPRSTGLRTVRDAFGSRNMAQVRYYYDPNQSFKLDRSKMLQVME